MKNTKISFLSLFVLYSLTWGKPILLDKTIAIVDEEVILQSDLEEALAQLKNQK